MASSSADRISSLPNDVREHILMFLPLRDAAKSSLLSPNWRNLWTNLPSLVFDQSFVHKRSVPRMIKDESLAFDAICNVLIHHRGPLRELTISVSISKVKIEQIMKLLHPQAIESLTIASDEVCYKLQMQMLSSFSQLRTLRLSCCELAFSPVLLQRFKHLTVLELRFAEFPQNPAEWRFSRWQFLTTLTLDRCYRPRKLPDIVIEEAPRLSCFHFAGKFNSLQLNSAPLLKTVFIRKTNLAWTVESNLLKVNGGLAAVESLSVAGFFYEYLATEEAQDVESNQKPFEKLRHMRLDNVCLSRTKHACSFLRLIISSPNLQQLTITVRSEWILYYLLTLSYHEF
ncbi:F-box/FBD/LRR-repeat protein At1g13570 [Linum perenne]